MKQKRFIVCTVLLIGFGLPVLIAQEALTTSGGDTTGIGGSVSYTVGQVLYTTSTGINGSVAEGVQQPYEISVVVGLEQVEDILLFCTIYPNPATDLLTIEVKIHDNENYFYFLYDMMGKLLVSNKLTDIKTIIPMTNLAPATYFLKVTDNQKIVKIFKITKN